MKILQIPKLRVWHFLGIVAAIATYLALRGFREEVDDPCAPALRQVRDGDVKARGKGVGGICSQMRPETFEALIAATRDADAIVRTNAVEWVPGPMRTCVARIA